MIYFPHVKELTKDALGIDGLHHMTYFTTICDHMTTSVGIILTSLLGLAKSLLCMNRPVHLTSMLLVMY